MPVWNRDRRRNSAPCFSKIVFAFLAFLTISSVLSLLKRVICVIAMVKSLLGFAVWSHRPDSCAAKSSAASIKSGETHQVGLGDDPKGSRKLAGRPPLIFKR